MEMHRLRRRRRSAALLVAALTASGLVLAVPAAAVPDVQSERIAGDDRFETAADIALAGFPDGSAQVVVASGRAFPDALAGAALGLPVLLTERDSVPAATSDAIATLEATEVIILGGTASVSDDVADDLDQTATVQRIAGNDRYETAAMIAESIGAGSVGTVDDLPTAIVATGNSFADALAGGPLATGADGADALPVLLVADEVPAATADAIDTLGIEQAIILGGTGAITADVEAEIEQLTGNDAVRLAGGNRYGTAVAVAEFAIETLAFPVESTILASGAEFADALAGGPLGGVRQAPLLLSDPVQLPDESEAFFEEHADTIETITTLGGTAAVSTSSAASAEAAAETPPEIQTNETYRVAPAAAASQANGSVREYTATGLGTTVVDIVIVRCSNVSTTSAGETKFVNTNGGTVADGTAEDPTSSGETTDVANTPAFISSVDGEARQADDPLINNDYAGGIAPTSGSVTFEVTGPSGSASASSCVKPIVFEDRNTDNALNVVAGATPALPDEVFGTGGSVTFSPAGAGAGQFTNKEVTDNDGARNIFTACTQLTTQPQDVANPDACASYAYDTNDRFQINSATVTLEVFETAMSPSDDVSGTYTDVVANQSTFNLRDEAPTAPGTPGAASTDSNGTTLTWGESQTPTVDSYRVYRALKGSAACAASVTGSTFLNTVVDGSPDGYNPTPANHTYTDNSAAALTDYCYNIVAVDDLDEGTPSAGVAVRTLADTGNPQITTASGSSADGILSANDTHQFVFNEPMLQLTDSTVSYNVRDHDTPNAATATVTCGGNATCTWLSTTTLRVRITETPSATEPTSGLTNPGTDGDLDYSLTITATTFKDAGGTAATLSGSDTSIEKDSLPGDVVTPYITSARMATEVLPLGWMEVGDVMAVTFSEAITLNDSDGVLTVDQVKAILGNTGTTSGTNITYAPGSVVTGTVSGGTVLNLTISGANLTDGVAVGDVTDGSLNNNILDLAGNPQEPNPLTNPALTAV